MGASSSGRRGSAWPRLLARLLGADLYGVYNIALSIATLGAAFAVIGLDSALIRYMAVYSRRSDRAGLLGTLRVGLGLPLLASLVAALALVAFAGPISHDIVGDPRMEAPIRIIAILVPAMVLNSVLAASLQGAQRIGWAVLAEQFAQPIVRFAVLAVFAVIGMTAEFALLGGTGRDAGGHPVAGLVPRSPGIAEGSRRRCPFRAAARCSVFPARCTSRT